jgi:hypothetical protein
MVSKEVIARDLTTNLGELRPIAGAMSNIIIVIVEAFIVSVEGERAKDENQGSYERDQ